MRSDCILVGRASGRSMLETSTKTTGAGFLVLGGSTAVSAWLNVS